MLILWSFVRQFHAGAYGGVLHLAAIRRAAAPGPIEGIGTGKPRSSGRQGGGHFKNEACRLAKILSRTTSTVFIHPW